MTTPEDPPRWSDGADAPEALASLLSAAKRDVATDAELSELGARLEPMPNPPTGTSSAPLFSKLAAGGLLALLGLGAVIGLRHSRSAVPPMTRAAPIAIARSAAPSSSASVPSPEPQSPELPNPAMSVAPAEVDSAPKPASSAGTGNRAPAGTAARVSNAVDAQAEASLLEQARSALAGNPVRALSLTQQHAQQFPHGLLVQEREVIAIAALRRLGRTTEAEARAARFDARYPHSVHQQAVDRTGSR